MLYKRYLHMKTRFGCGCGLTEGCDYGCFLLGDRVISIEEQEKKYCSQNRNLDQLA